jgi:hypothetical protein
VFEVIAVFALQGEVDLETRMVVVHIKAYVCSSHGV